ncbi:MAG: helix-turn-helix domain-containing protein [Paludibacteraceae bacterium]|nr:helix-turn-helix domain-containing protein [Paludibacteraceae bacterium]
MNQQPIDVFEFSRLKQDDNIIYYKDKFFLGDNLGKKLDLSNYGHYLSLYPVKTQFTSFLFCCKGNLKIRINFKDYEVSASEAVLIISNSLSQILDISEQSEIIIMAFADDTFFTSLSVSDKALFFSKIQESPVVSIPENRYNSFIEIYKLLRSDMTSDDFQFKSSALKGYVEILTAHARNWITSFHKNEEEFTHNRATQIYMKFVKYVNEFHSKHRDVTFYAEKMCLSPKYLSQVILSVSGKYALDIIKDQVIFEAKALLKSRKYSVQEVAYMLNFPNPSFFGKYFRSEVGCSPRTYMTSEDV